MRRNRNNKPIYGVILLFSELFQNDRLPPVTLSVLALNVAIYLELFNIDYPSLPSVCLSANYIITNKEWLRLLLSQIFHADDFHLYYNMVSFSIKGRSLERRFGPVYFLCLLFVFTISCSLTLVGLETMAANFLDNKHLLDSCAVGFSGVIFALKVLTTHYLPSGTNYLFGTVPITSKYIYWVELILISLVTPNASFAGHLAGIIVGLLYIYGPLKHLIEFIVPREHIRNQQYNRDMRGGEEEWRSARLNYRNQYW